MPPDPRPTIAVATKASFPFLWCRSLTGACLAGQRCCAQALYGQFLSFLPPGRKRPGQTFRGFLDEHGGSLMYLCGVLGGTTNWHRNTHLLLRPAADSRFALEDDTIRVEVVGADPVPLKPLPVRVAARLTDRRARCRCVWAAYGLFPDCRRQLMDDSPGLFD
jgi:hypothetical protein